MPAPESNSGDISPRHRQADDDYGSSLGRTVSWSSNLPAPHGSPSRARESSIFNNNTISSNYVSNSRNMAAVNEETPINAHSSVARRDYQSTDNLPNGLTGNADQNGQLSRRRLSRQETEAGNDNGNGNDNDNDRDDDHDSRQPWLRRFADKYGSLELDNKGSVARDHLALERTFLAWLRTSLAFASIGIAVTQLFRLNSSITPDKSQTSSNIDPSRINNNPSFPVDNPGSSLLELLLAPPSSFEEEASGPGSNMRLRNVGKPLGATFIAIAILILLIGFHRYFEAQYWIVRGKFPASRGSVALVTFVAAGLIVSSFVVILAIAPTALER